MSNGIIGRARMFCIEMDEPAVCISCHLHIDPQAMVVSIEESPWVCTLLGRGRLCLNWQSIERSNTTFDHPTSADGIEICSCFFKLLFASWKVVPQPFTGDDCSDDTVAMGMEG